MCTSLVTEGFASPKVARILLAVSAISHSSPTRLQSSDALVVQKHHLLNLQSARPLLLPHLHRDWAHPCQICCA